MRHHKSIYNKPTLTFFRFNKTYLLLASITILLLLMFSCKKQEKVAADPPKVINLQIEGSTVNDTLEFVKNGRVIGQSPRANGDFTIDIMITLDQPEAELQIRKKGQSDIIGTRKIVANKFNQTIRCYYDGVTAYDETVVLKIKGYSAVAVLEVVMDGRVIAEGNNYISPEQINIGFEPEQKHLIQIRKKGDNAILLAREISPEEAKKPIKYYYDGFTLRESINFPVPENPANMLFTAKFTSIVNVYNGPLDILFFNGTSTKPYEHTATNIRVEIPTDGTFSKAIEIPPVAAGLKYSYKLVKRGTLNDLPYILTNELMPIKPESGYRLIEFKPGYTLMADITDRKDVRTSGTIKGTNFFISEKDIKFYFDN
jgi:hypothetical protein